VTGDGELLDLIGREIHMHGPMTFARYMELALYHPEFGYYRTRDRFGAAGDFYTAEQLQPVFGEVIAACVEKLTQQDARPNAFGVLELGAGRAEMKEALSRWNYRAFDWGSAPLPESWTGLVFANEFFDALPVHLLRKEESGWRERLVTCCGKDLCFATRPLDNPELLTYAREYGSLVPDGGELEACLAIPAWLRKIADVLDDGRLLVIDYGYNAQELTRFPAGTLLSYRNHHAASNPLANAGTQDITAHVNFTWLSKCAEAVGFAPELSESLASWLLSTWGEEELGRRWALADQRWRLQWKQLVFGMGETFRVLQFRRIRRQA
jgi:SAM-dependent MidA family methyltransferase